MRIPRRIPRHSSRSNDNIIVNVFVDILYRFGLFENRGSLDLVSILMNHYFPLYFPIQTAMFPGGKAVAHTLTPVTIRMLQEGA